jgi:hypothetical protein
MARLDHLQDGEWAEHSHPPIFVIDEAHQRSRILATAPAGNPLILSSLAACLSPPYVLLYILHTPRGEGEPGRYQSPDLTKAQLDGFLTRFGDYLRGDGRFDLWVHSPEHDGTIVWDRHNLVFAYGPTGRFATALRGLGFTPGEPRIPSPHTHNYRAELDQDARALLADLSWTRSALRAEDEQ